MSNRQMDRRDFLRFAGAGAVLVPLGKRALGADAPGAKRPNIVLIISDDQGYTDYGFMGHKTVKTPRIDALARQSLVYTRGYVPTALCCPSLATMLTGLYAHQHKITGNDPVQRNERPKFFDAFSRAPRMPAMLSKAGYVSHQSGKYWMGHYSRAGFTEGMTVSGRHGGPGLKIGRTTMKPIFDFIDKSRAAAKPFFIWYAPFMPHTPHNPPKRLRDKYAAAGRTNAAYYAMCEWFDETCGQLLDHLDAAGLADNTIVLYVCDNGWPRSVKGSPYELGARTPIMARWPGRVKPRMDKETLASSIDLVPTILTAAGLSPTKDMPGLNLIDHAAMAKRKAIFGENFCHDMADVDRPADSLRARTCIEGDWKLIVWQDVQPKVKTTNNTRKTKGTIELYNLKADPTETTDLSAKEPAKVAALTKLLDAFWKP